MYLDLTQTIHEGMPVYEGTPKPRIDVLATIAQHGYRESHLFIASHMGTHVDAPFHILEGGKKLDEYEIDAFIGTAMVIDLRSFRGAQVPVVYIQEQLEEAERKDFVLLYTGCAHQFDGQDYMKDLPILSIEAAAFLAGWVKKGIGLDGVSVDDLDSKDFPIHQTFMKCNHLIMENLKPFDMLLGESFELYCMPLKYRNADGAPARVFAKVRW